MGSRERWIEAAPAIHGMGRFLGPMLRLWTSDGKEFLFQATRDGRTEVWSVAVPDLLSRIFHLRREPVQLSRGPVDSLVP